MPNSRTHAHTHTHSHTMLRSCVCFGGNHKRRSSSFDTSSSCRSSEIERGGKTATTTATTADGSQNALLANGHFGTSLLQYFQTKGWYRNWRKPTRGISMTKIEISKYRRFLYDYHLFTYNCYYNGFFCTFFSLIIHKFFYFFYSVLVLFSFLNDSIIV